MMSDIASHLVRRGVEHFGTFSATEDGGDKHEIQFDVSRPAMLLVGTTVLCFLLSIFAIKYTYANVIGTLTIIESPKTDAYVAVQNLAAESPNNDTTKPPAYSETNDNGPPIEPEMLVIKTKPITSSLRTTLQHLRAKAGRFSRFRGLSLFLCWIIVRSLIANLLAHIIPLPGFFLRYSVAAITSEVLLARWELTWYHIVISEPSDKKWWWRLPPFKSSWAKIAPAVAIRAIATRITSSMPMMLAGCFGTMKKIQDPDFHPGKKDMHIALGQSFMVFFLTCALFVLLEIPATVTVVRVAASMLPEEDETIVPFDRSFGGKVTPAIIGGAGKIGIVEAWRSFAWSSRVRLLKLIGKVLAIIFAVWMLFVMVLVAEMHIVLGDKMGEIMKRIHDKAGQN